MESEPKHKQQVLEWIEDFKAGLVQPPKPFEVQASKREVSVFPIGIPVSIISIALAMRYDHVHWWSIHNILEVEDYIEKKILR